VLFVDANIFIRILTRDDPVQSPKALAFMDKVADGLVTARTTEGVLLEVVQVLVSKNGYGLERERIRDSLVPIITLRDLHIDYRDVHLRALDRFAGTRLDYVDCLAVEYARTLELDGIVSFDRGLDRIEDVKRIEPDRVH
jgi:predicted nucleic-acid-binding protein